MPGCVRTGGRDRRAGALRPPRQVARRRRRSPAPSASIQPAGARSGSNAHGVRARRPHGAGARRDDPRRVGARAVPGVRRRARPGPAAPSARLSERAGGAAGSAGASDGAGAGVRRRAAVAGVGDAGDRRPAMARPPPGRRPGEPSEAGRPRRSPRPVTARNARVDRRHAVLDAVRWGLVTDGLRSWWVATGPPP